MKKPYDGQLFEAIKATFKNRSLVKNDDLQLFTEEFYTDEARLQRWASFLKKIQWKENLSFVDVMKVIRERLQGMYDRYSN